MAAIVVAATQKKAQHWTRGYSAKIQHTGRSIGNEEDLEEGHSLAVLAAAANLF